MLDFFCYKCKTVTPLHPLLASRAVPARSWRLCFPKHTPPPHTHTLMYTHCDQMTPFSYDCISFLWQGVNHRAYGSYSLLLSWYPSVCLIAWYWCWFCWKHPHLYSPLLPYCRVVTCYFLLGKFLRYKFFRLSFYSRGKTYESWIE